MSGDPEQEYFADGMVEEIITALSPHPLAVRHRPQFELHLQRPSRRREAGRARIGRALRARRLGAQGRRSGAHHRAADRGRDRRASLGRPVRRLARRCLRASGQGGDRASPASSSRRCRPPRSPRLPSRPTDDLTAYDLYLRALAHRFLAGNEIALRGARSARAGDRARSALRPGSRLGGVCCIPNCH